MYGVNVHHPKRLLTQEQLKTLLHYDPFTGKFTWLVDGPHRGIGKEAGGLSGGGYHMIGINRHRYNASVLAWLYMTGEWPNGLIDHEDLNRANNRWKNLRLATRSQNNANKALQRNNTLGFKGVTKANGRYRARFSIHLGYFDTAEEAAAAYAEFSNRVFGKFARSA